MDAEPSPPYQRDESAAQRLDRNWNELLQEIRVLQTGSQILAAFLIVLPFQSRFEELDAFQTGWHLGLLLLRLVIVAVLLTPSSEEHTSELQSRGQLACRPLRENEKTAGFERD